MAIMSTLFFCGDTHGQFDHLIEAARLHKPAAMILLGDIQATAPLHEIFAPVMEHTEIWFIHGNHDTDSVAQYDHLYNSSLASNNLHGRVCEVAGYRIAGLGGIFRGQIWMPGQAQRFFDPAAFMAAGGRGNQWRTGVSRKHRSSIFPSDIAGLQGQKADILVTHEAPSCHPHGFVPIDHLARQLKVSVSFHGHHHDRRDYSRDVPRLGFQPFGVGLRGITALNGEVIRPGDMDHVEFPVDPRRRPRGV